MVDRQDIPPGYSNRAGTHHVENHLALVQAWCKLVEEHDAEQLGVVVLLEGEEVLAVIHVTNDSLLRLYLLSIVCQCRHQV